MKCIYEVGDTAYIRDDGKFSECKFLEIHHGEKATITKIDRDGEYCHIEIGKRQRFAKPEMFVQPSIIISVVGRKVIAQKGDKEGIACCHPDDKFDLMTGAKLALERLEEAMRIPAWLRKGTKYYTVNISDEEMYHLLRFCGDELDKRYLARGLVFQTKEEAIEATKKMLKALEE